MTQPPVDPAPRIAIFDSGVGGLTVAGAVHRALPAAHIRYLGDTARLPYGTKSASTVTRYALQAAEALMAGPRSGAPISALVVACNTASSCALPALEAHFDLPVIGVVEPGARRAVAASHSGIIGVVGTERTVASGAYTQAIHALDPSARVYALATPLLVTLAEEGWFDHPVTEAALVAYLQPWLQDPEVRRIDTLVLGCTHYPVFKPTIARVWRQLTGRDVVLVDSADAVALDLQARLGPRGQGTGGSVELLATDALERFLRVGGLFFPVRASHTRLIDL